MPGTLEEASCFDCDDFSDRVSDCSMENNRSITSSPLSLIDERTILPDDDDQLSHFSQRIPVAGLNASAAGLTAIKPVIPRVSMDSPAHDQVASTINQNQTHPIGTELAPYEVCAENRDCIIPPLDMVRSPSRDHDLMVLKDSDDLLLSEIPQLEETLNQDLIMDT